MVIAFGGNHTQNPLFARRFHSDLFSSVRWGLVAITAFIPNKAIEERISRWFFGDTAQNSSV